eukprot:TRINITY_DN4141_c0_g1_i10.p1 TRINITY_DN4141_c0_g1~~TRINITY_DN4141_c0_g1_i10.p1  ORF type:complete len:167 (+),score=40.65 TRINITY_DN4141_c0_g1_i10:131-631(+)
MIRRPPRSTLSSSSAASDVYKRQVSTQSTGGTFFDRNVARGNGRVMSMSSDEDEELPTRESIKLASQWHVRNATTVFEQSLPSGWQRETSSTMGEDQPSKKRRAKLHKKADGTKSQISRLKREIKMLKTRYNQVLLRGGSSPEMAETIQKTIRGKQKLLAVLIVES